MKFLSTELETAFENLKTATELGVPIMAPSPDTGETENAARGPPKPYELDNTQFNNAIRGSMLLTHDDKINAVPLHSAVKPTPEGDTYRIATAKRSGTGTWVVPAYQTREQIGMNYKAALLGVCTEGNRSGPHAGDLTAAGLKATISIEAGEEIDTLSIKILDGDPQIMAADEALKILEQKWQPMFSDAVTDSADAYAGLPTVETLQNSEISWEKIEGVQFPGWRRAILMGIHINASETGVSAYHLGSLTAALVGAPAAQTRIFAAALVASVNDPTPPSPGGGDGGPSYDILKNRQKYGRDLLNRLLATLDAYPHRDLQAAASKMEALAAQGLQVSAQLAGGLLRCQATRGKDAGNTDGVVPPMPQHPSASDLRATNWPETQTQEQTQTTLTQQYQSQQLPVGGTSPSAQDRTSTGRRRSPRISPPQAQSADARALGNKPPLSGPPFKELIPLEIASASEVEVMLKISEELNQPDVTALAATLRAAAGRELSEQSLALIARDRNRLAKQAAENWQIIIHKWLPALPSDFLQRPHSWVEATDKFIKATELAMQSKPNKQGSAAGAPQAGGAVGSWTDSNRLGARRQFSNVSETSKEADGAVPATWLAKLATVQAIHIEEVAAESASTRGALEEGARIIKQHGAEGAAALLSNGCALGGRGGADGKIAGSIVDARDKIVSLIDITIADRCLGQSQRLRDSLQKERRSARDSVLFGAVNLEHLVAVFGAVKSSGGAAEAGANPRDPSAGRAGSMQKDFIQSDVPRALENYCAVLLMIHVGVGNAVAPEGRAEDLGLAQLWRDSQVLPLQTKTMSDGTEVVGSIRLLTYALECIGRAMRKKRVECTGDKLDFKAIADEVYKTELHRAVERQQFYSFAEAASKTLGGKRDAGDANDSNKPPGKKPKAAANSGADASGKQQPAAGKAAAAAPAGAAAGSGNGGELPWPLTKNSITHKVGPAGDQHKVPNIVTTAEHFLRKEYPNLPPKQWPCVWQSLFQAGCKNKACVRCLHQKSLVEKKVGATPLPAGLLEKLRRASTPAVAETLRK